MSTHDRDALSALVAPCGQHQGTVAEVLRLFPPSALRLAHRERCRIQTLRPGELYREASPALARLGIDVDAWPSPPAGLFVVEERTVYLRSLSPMTVAHEFGHAVDCALGGGMYRSGIDPTIRAAFANATTFLTPYSATGVDEYFAEGLRAWVGANDPASAWPSVNRARLAKVDPALHDYLAATFAEVR